MPITNVTHMLPISKAKQSINLQAILKSSNKQSLVSNLENEGISFVKNIEFVEFVTKLGNKIKIKWFGDSTPGSAISGLEMITKQGKKINMDLSGGSITRSKIIDGGLQWNKSYQFGKIDTEKLALNGNAMWSMDKGRRHDIILDGNTFRHYIGDGNDFSRGYSVKGEFYQGCLMLLKSTKDAFMKASDELYNLTDVVRK